jgi:hypothetical protein
VISSSGFQSWYSEPMLDVGMHVATLLFPLLSSEKPKNEELLN